MKFTAFLMLLAFLQASATGYTQKININARNAGLQKVFQQIEQQTDYQFFYNERLLLQAKKVNLHMKDASLEEVLAACFQNQPLAFSIIRNTIIIKPRTADQEELPLPPPINVSGRVVNENGTALSNVSIVVKGTSKGTNTNSAGEFSLTGISEDAVLQISSVGYESQEVPVQNRTSIEIQLKIVVKGLDETVVIAYGTTSKRLNTGSVSSITSKEIGQQPVADPLAAIQGRISGLMITPSSGLPGSSFQVRVRGENSIKQGSDPLYIIDGVPFFSSPINMFSGANGNQSPLSSINPADIERIDVLKDADATAIYGSRGANGVVLITTKKGKSGESVVNLNIYTGQSRVSNQLDLLNTEQYLQMRREAFELDAVLPSATTAPDLLEWDPKAYTNWQDLLMGNTAKLTEAQVAFSGGTAQTRFRLSGNYRHETTVLLGDFSFRKGGMQLNADHQSQNGKFGIASSVNFNLDENNSVPTDVSQYIYLPPNMPRYNPDGSLYWFGTSLQNPLAYLNRTYETSTNNLIANTVLRYGILEGLDIKTNLGFTQTQMKQVLTLPAAGFNPATFTGSSSQFGNSAVRSYIIEPQLDYNLQAGPGNLHVLAGASWQQNVIDGQFLQGTGYSSDALLKDMQSASSLTVRSVDSRRYNYQSVFGRLNYNVSQKYLLNLTFRRDGSSRFGPGKRFGNFGAIGAGWIFTNEHSLKNALSFLSYGKLRGSYGSTGNDQIGDYQFLDTWGSTTFPYAGSPGLSPTRVYNPDYSWEINKKLEAGLELGFMKDQLLVTVNYYDNRSSNQLIGYTLSSQSGFTSYTANLPATVQNSGWEFEIQSTNVKKNRFTWTTGLNVSFPANKLLDYPNLENSADAASFEVGQSIRLIKGFKFTGVNSETGIPEFLDVDKDGKISSPNDYVVLGETMPEFFGGLNNNISYRNFSLNFFFQFVKQESITQDWGPLVGVPGSLNNKDVSLLNRWQETGDITNIPRPSATASNAANTAYRNYYRSSSAAWGDASYIRLKTLSLSYDLGSLVSRWGLRNANIYIQGQNLLTFTKYNGLDPEINGFDRRFVFPINPFGSVKTQAIPVLKTITLGLQLSL